MAIRKKRSISVRQKGKTGELEFCKWLKESLRLKVEPTRNLEQWRSGGCDVLLEPFAFEVKRHQNPDLQAFWTQASINAKKVSTHKVMYEPVVAYRVNRGQWQFLLTATNIGMDKGWLHVNERIAVQYLRARMGVVT